MQSEACVCLCAQVWWRNVQVNILQHRPHLETLVNWISVSDRTSLVISRLHFCVNVASRWLSSHHKVLNPDRITENQLNSKRKKKQAWKQKPDHMMLSLHIFRTSEMFYYIGEKTFRRWAESIWAYWTSGTKSCDNGRPKACAKESQLYAYHGTLAAEWKVSWCVCLCLCVCEWESVCLLCGSPHHV